MRLDVALLGALHLLFPLPLPFFRASLLLRVALVVGYAAPGL